MRRYDLNNKTKDLEYHSGEYYSTIRYPKIAKHETDIGKGSLSISAGKQIRVPKRLQDILADFEEIKTERS